MNNPLYVVYDNDPYRVSAYDPKRDDDANSSD